MADAGTLTLGARHAATSGPRRPAFSRRRDTKTSGGYSAGNEQHEGRYVVLIGHAIFERPYRDSRVMVIPRFLIGS